MANRAFDLIAGTRDFYADPSYYNQEFDSRKADAAWYRELYLQIDGPVLELGVGSGRVALKAVRKGAHVVGIDLSESMLEAAEAGRGRLPIARRPFLELHHGDMRNFELNQKFRLVSCPFNAFQHLYTLEDARRCLREVDRHLEPGGRFVVDVLLPDFEYLMRPAFKRFVGLKLTHPTWQTQYTYSEQSAYDAATQLNQMVFTYDRAGPKGRPDAPDIFTIELSHRCFFPMEMSALLESSGFEILDMFGDFENEPLRNDSESMVFIARRKGDD